MSMSCSVITSCHHLPFLRLLWLSCPRIRARCLGKHLIGRFDFRRTTGSTPGLVTGGQHDASAAPGSKAQHADLDRPCDPGRSSFINS